MPIRNFPCLLWPRQNAIAAPRFRWGRKKPSLGPARTLRPDEVFDLPANYSLFSRLADRIPSWVRIFSVVLNFDYESKRAHSNSENILRYVTLERMNSMTSPVVESLSDSECDGVQRRNLTAQDIAGCARTGGSVIAMTSGVHE